MVKADGVYHFDGCDTVLYLQTLGNPKNDWGAVQIELAERETSGNIEAFVDRDWEPVASIKIQILHSQLCDFIKWLQS